jgi:hypothetical protein
VPFENQRLDSSPCQRTRAGQADDPGSDDRCGNSLHDHPANKRNAPIVYAAGTVVSAALEEQGFASSVVSRYTGSHHLVDVPSAFARSPDVHSQTNPSHALATAAPPLAKE